MGKAGGLMDELVTVTLTREQFEDLRTALKGAASLYQIRPIDWPGEPEGYEVAARGILELVALLPPPPPGPYTCTAPDPQLHGELVLSGHVDGDGSTDPEVVSLPWFRVLELI